MPHPPKASSCHTIAPPLAYAVVDPLILPEPGTHPTACPSEEQPGRDTCRQPIEGDLQALRQAETGVIPHVLRAPESPDERARYRWLVGHHAAFASWQILRRSLEYAVHGSEPQEPAIRIAAWLYDVYSTLLLYTGSCSAQRYAATVRSDMIKCHPSFSGEWARDYEAIPVLTKHVRARHSREMTAPLAEAVRRNHLVHMAVARKLVPDGTSLLQQAGRQPGDGPTQADRDLYDSYFTVRRRPLCESAFAAQLLRRLAQVLCDISMHGLTDSGSPHAGLGPPYTGSIGAFVHKAPVLLCGLAEHTAAEAWRSVKRTTVLESASPRRRPDSKGAPPWRP